MNKYFNKVAFLIIILSIGFSCFCKNDVKVKSIDLKSRPKPVYIKEKLGAKDSGLKAFMILKEDTYMISLQTDAAFNWEKLFPSGVENYRIVIEFVTSEMKKAAELQVSFADFVKTKSDDDNLLVLEKKLSIGSDYRSFAANYLIIELKGE